MPSIYHTAAQVTSTAVVLTAMSPSIAQTPSFVVRRVYGDSVESPVTVNTGATTATVYVSAFTTAGSPDS